MFLSNKKYWVVEYKYSDELDNHLQSIKNFLSNLIITNHKEFQILDISKDNILEKEEQHIYNSGEDLKEVINIYISAISINLTKNLQEYLDKKLIEEVSSNSKALFIYKKKIFYIKKGINETSTIISKIDGKLKRKIEKENILKNKILDFWQQHVNNNSMDILKVFIEHKTDNISLIEDDGEAKNIDFLPIPLTTLTIEYDKNKKELTQQQLKIINQLFPITIHSGEIIISEGKIDNNLIGLVIGEYLFLYNAYPILENELNKDKNIKLNYLKTNILKEDSKKRGRSKKIDEFVADLSNDMLIDSLKDFKNNLYIDNNFDDINSKIKDKYYSIGYMIESDYLGEHQCFVPYIEGDKPLFGLHNNSNARDNKGVAEKGLKSWINSKNKEQNTASPNTPTKAKKVMHLLPDIAFYFKEKFFEDYLEILLNEIKNEMPQLNIEIITNKIFYINTNNRITNPLSLDSSLDRLQEFDFIVNYSKDSITYTVVIEAKTKLSKFIIQDQADKVEKYMLYDDLKIFDKYFLVGFNTDDTVDKAMAYFIKNMSIEDTSDLGFEYPLPTTEKTLYCIASNNRDILKQNLLALFI